MNKYLLTAVPVCALIFVGTAVQEANAQGCYSDFGGVYVDAGYSPALYSGGWGGYSDSYGTAYLGYYPRTTVRSYYPSHYAPSLFNFHIGGHHGHSLHSGGHHGHGSGRGGHHF